jgi:hypothetical protein
VPNSRKHWNGVGGRRLASFKPHNSHLIQQAVSWRTLEDESLFQGGFMVKERNKEA